MADIKKTNLLSDDAKKDVQDVSLDQIQNEADIRLVVPEVRDNLNQESGDKESWSARRKRKKALKLAQKLRRKGETGSAPTEANTEEKSIASAPKAKPDLFDDAPKVALTKQKPAVRTPKIVAKKPFIKKDQKK